MRVGLVSNLGGGLKQFSVNLCRGLREKGFDMEVLCPARMVARDVGESFADTPVHVGLQAIRRLLADRYDLVHYNIAVLGVLPIIKSMLDQFPLVQTFHGIPHWAAEPRVIDKIRYAMEHNAVRLTGGSAVVRVSVSRFVESTMKKWLGIDSTVIYHGIAHHPQGNSREESRKQLGLEDESTVILFVGRLHPYKDPFTLLRAVSLLANQGRNVRLVVVGDGPLSNSFHKMVSKIGLGGQVTSWSQVSQSSLHSIYSATDIFCLPSINEAFGIVVLEAMDHGVPLVVSKSGALPEVVGDAGLKFETGNESDLCRKLGNLIDDRTLRETLGQRGRLRAESHFSLNSMIERYALVYQEAMG